MTLASRTLSLGLALAPVVLAPSLISPASAQADGADQVRDAAEENQSGGDGRDVDFLWIEANAGASFVNLVAFQNSNFSGNGSDSLFREVSGVGGVVGAALGFRVFWLAIGARATFAGYDGFQIGTVGGEATLRFPIPIIEPWIRLGFGYAWQGDANYSNVSGSSTTVYGWDLNAGAGLDIYLTNWLTVGGGVTFDLLNMSRQRDITAECMGVTDICPSMDGDAVGIQGRLFGTVGLHF